MSKMEIQIKGTGAMLLLGALLLLGGYRAVSFDRSDDPALREAVRTELNYDVTGNISDALQGMNEENNYAGISELIDDVETGATVYSLTISKPLFSWSSKEKIIVKAEYKLPNESKRSVIYMKFDYYRIDNRWRFRHEVSALSFYLNFT